MDLFTPAYEMRDGKFQLTMIIDLFTPRLGGGEYKFSIYDTEFNYSPPALEEEI